MSKTCPCRLRIPLLCLDCVSCAHTSFTGARRSVVSSSSLGRMRSPGSDARGPRSAWAHGCHDQGAHATVLSFVVGCRTPVIVWLRSKRTASCIMSKQSASLVTSAPSPGRKLHHTIKVASSACSELPSPVTATLMSARTASGRGGHGRPHSPTS